jgi:hypothetical protein
MQFTEAERPVYYPQDRAVSDLDPAGGPNVALRARAGSPDLCLVTMGIPTKANAVPEGSRTAFRDRSEHPSERSDAGLLILQ